MKMNPKRLGPSRMPTILYAMTDYSHAEQGEIRW